jgi:Ice-binding-like
VHKFIALLSWAAFSVCLNAQLALGPTVGTFGVLAGSTVTSTGNTLVTGNLGVSPGTAITGFAGIAPGGPGLVTGTIHSADAVAAQAQSELTTAYNAAAGAASTATKNGDLGGQTLFAGVYTASSSLGLTGTVTLDAQNNSNAQFIFQIGTALTANVGSSVNLINGALPANVFWQVGSSATVGTGASFSGNILAFSSISLGTNATLQGRALARNGAVTMAGTDTITTPATLGGPGGGPPAPGGTGLPAGAAPSSLILVAIALVCAGIYGARKRLPKLLGRN